MVYKRQIPRINLQVQQQVSNAFYEKIVAFDIILFRIGTQLILLIPVLFT